MTVTADAIDPDRSAILPPLLSAAAGEYVEFYLRLRDTFGNQIDQMDPYSVAQQVIVTATFN